MLKVYGFSRVNDIARGRTRDLRVLWALEEMQWPFELVGMDHPTHALETGAYRTLSPFAQIPAIDDDGLVLSESAAILVYLAKKAGKLIPADLAGEAQVVRWCFAAMNTVEIPLETLMFVDWMSQGDPKDGKGRAFLADWSKRALQSLEGWLEGRQFVATDSFTIADILMAHVLTEIEDKSLLQDRPKIVDYRDRCFARPAWKKVLAAYMARVQPE